MVKNPKSNSNGVVELTGTSRASLLKKIKIGALLIPVFVGVWLFSNWCATSTYHSDFGGFYRAGHIILDGKVPVTDIYRTDDFDISQYNIPDEEKLVLFRYSMFAAYVFAPLAYFSYDTANAIFIFLNIVAYLFSVILVLRACGAKGRWFVYPLMLSLFWMPFIQNAHWGQTNALILLFITLGIIGARNSRFWTSGIALAIATLFKPFALAVTMVMCLKNWRIAVSYITVMTAALILIPGTAEWFHSFLWPPHPWFCYSAMYLFLHNIEPILFWAYALTIGAITALVAYRHRYLDFMAIGSLAIPGAFMAMPILEIQHPTVLIFTYAYLVTRKLSTTLKLSSAVSFLLVGGGSITTQVNWILYLGIFIVWLTMILFIESVDHKLDDRCSKVL